MHNRYRVEIYDDIKSNDMTMYLDNNIDREYLSEIVFSKLRFFSGNVKAYVYDSVKKKKTAALIFPMETVAFVKSKIPA